MLCFKPLRKAAAQFQLQQASAVRNLLLWLNRRKRAA
jgi:hypothetical protein